MRYTIEEIGKVVKEGDKTHLKIHPEFVDGLKGLNVGDWILLFLWFHRSDNPSMRAIKQVHPYGNPENPLTGVFATRSPVRPNPVGFYVVQILSIEGDTLEVSYIDAYPDTPIFDIKIFVERLDCPQKSPVDERKLRIRRGFQAGALNLIPSVDGRLVVELKGETEVLDTENVKKLRDFLSELAE